MFDAIFKASSGNLNHLSSFVTAIETLVVHFAQDYMKDKNARDAAVDALVEYLETLKTKG